MLKWLLLFKSRILALLRIPVLTRQTVAQAFVRANLIHKCFVSRDTFTLMRAFKVSVKPIVDYMRRAYGRHTVLIESVQR